MLEWYHLTLSYYIQECPICLKHKGNLPKPTHLHQHPFPKKPWQRTSMDILGPFKKTFKNKKYILVFTDHLTRYNGLISLPDQTSEIVRRALLERIIQTYGTPEILVSDNAANFTSKLLDEICRLCNIEKVHIVPYHPTANGLVVRLNCKILKLLRTMSDISTQWDDCLTLAQTAINNTTPP